MSNDKRTAIGRLRAALESGRPYSRRVGTVFGAFDEPGSLMEVGDDWVEWRPDGSDAALVFGCHPLAVGPLSALRCAR